MSSTVVMDDKAKQKRDLQERFSGYPDFEVALRDVVYGYVPEGAVPYAPFMVAAHALASSYPDGCPKRGISANAEIAQLRHSLNETRSRRRSGHSKVEVLTWNRQGRLL